MILYNLKLSRFGESIKFKCEDSKELTFRMEVNKDKTNSVEKDLTCDGESSSLLLHFNHSDSILNNKLGSNTVYPLECNYALTYTEADNSVVIYYGYITFL
jgi:hypothetical protein